MQVILNQILYPYRTNRYYRHLLEKLADKNVYDVSYAAIGRRQSYYSAPVINSIAETNTPSADLSPGTYYYTLVGVTAYGETMIAREMSVIITAPNNSAVLSWSGVPSATAYRIFRSATSGNYSNTFVAEVVGSSFTDTGYATQLGYPLASLLKVTGAVTPVGIYEVKLMVRNREENEVYTSMAETTSKPDGTFEFTVSLPRGENELYALVSNENSARIFVNVYNLHLYFEAIANELLNFWQEMVEQGRANTFIDPTQNMFDSNYRYPTDKALREAWGDMLDAFRPSTYTTDEYRIMLKGILEAHSKATTFAAIKKVFEMFQNSPDYRRIVFFGKGSYHFKIGERFAFKAVRTFGVGNPTLDYEWTGGNLYFNGQRGYIPGGTGSLVMTGAASYNHVFYIDGDRDSDGYFVIKSIVSPWNNLGFVSALPVGVKVLAMFKTTNDDIVQINGMNFIGSYSTIPTYNGPFHVGPSFITNCARIMSERHRGSRFMVYFNSVFGSGYLTDPEYGQKVDMIIKILKAVKPAKTTIGFGSSPGYTLIEI